MQNLKHILEKYAAFETEVTEFTSELLKPWCHNCKGECCKADCCRETLDSSFLSLLLTQFPPRVKFSAHNGWLTKSGCALAMGRPPVCYEFLCDRVLDALATPINRYAMVVLSKLVSYVGQRATGRSHLVEIMDPSDLSTINFDSFGRRLIEAQKAFKVVRSILAEKPIPEDVSLTLSRISKPPQGLTL
jgi:hypothetical protein